MERSIKINISIILGWVLFILCLIMPAITEHGKSATGYTYGMLAIKEIPSIFKEIYELKWPIVNISGIGNIFALLSIVFVFIKDKIILYSFASLCALFFLNNAYYLSNNELSLFNIGYYTWLLSYITLCVALLWSASIKISLTKRSSGTNNP